MPDFMKQGLERGQRTPSSLSTQISTSHRSVRQQSTIQHVATGLTPAIYSKTGGLQGRRDAEAEQQIMDLSKENTTLSIRLLETRNTLRQVKLEGLQTIKKLKEQNTELSVQNTYLMRQSSKGSQASNALQDLRDQIAVLEKDNTNLHKDLKDHIRSKRGIENQLCGVKKSYHDLLNCVSEMTDNSCASRRQISELEKLNNQLSTALQEAQRKETEDIAIRRALSGRLRDVEKENVTLRSEIDCRIKSEAETDRKLVEATEREMKIKEECENMRRQADEEKQNSKLLACENSELNHQLVLAEEARIVSVNSAVELEKQLADLTLAADDAHGFKRKIVEAFKCCMTTILFC